MKKIEKIAANAVKKAIGFELYGWPPGCLGTLYQPERPKVKSDGTGCANKTGK